LAPAAQAVGRLKNLRQEDVDWHLLLEAADLHGLIPLLFLNLKRFCSQSAPPDVMEHLKVQFFGHSRRSLKMVDELKVVLRKLDSNGIVAVLFKGPHLAERYYKDLLLRTFCDLDLWVRQSDVAAAQQCLEQLGYKACAWRNTELGAKFMQSAMFRRLCFEYAYMKGSGSENNYIDLHWKVLPPDLFPISEEQLQKHVRKSILWGVEVAHFTDEMTLLLVCVHGCKHSWSQVSWIVDAAKIIEQGEIDWTNLLNLADQIGAQKMLLSGLFLANQVTNIDLPAQVVERLSNSNAAASCREISERFRVNPAAPDWKEMKKWLYFFQLQSGWFNRLSFVVQKCTRPTLDEWLRLALPQQLYPVYYLLRPVNLFVDHVPRILLRFISGGYDARLNIKSDR
jgi:hypothetical protein